VNAVEKNLQQKDFAYEFDGLDVGDEDNLGGQHFYKMGA
jgi:hypothetical protein